MTIRLDPEVKERLQRLARDTRRSRSYLAAEAVAGYVDRELEIIEAVRRGLADAEAGRVVPHDDVLAEAGRVISDTRTRKARRR